MDLETSLSSSDELEEDTEIRSTPTCNIDEVLGLESHSPIYIPEESRPEGQLSKTIPTPTKLPSTSASASASQRQTPTLPIPIGRGGTAQGHSSKASLASPEEISLEEAVFAKLGTSV